MPADRAATATVLAFFLAHHTLRYGHDQTFIHLPKDATPFRAGDSLTFTCVFDSTTAKHAVHYGVSHGDEMCAPIILYYPHQRGNAGYSVNNFVGFEEAHTRAEDRSEGEVVSMLRADHKSDS